jgi:hypothetical protein
VAKHKTTFNDFDGEALEEKTSDDSPGQSD